jgi:hypothetical protein
MVYQVDIRCNKKCGKLVMAGRTRSLRQANKTAVALTNHLHVSTLVWNKTEHKVESRYEPAAKWIEA